MIAYIREMQIKTTMKYYLTVVRMAIVKNLQVTNIEEGAEKTEPSYTVGENVSWCSHYGKQYGFLKKLKIELPHDSAIPLLGIYPDKTLIQKDTCTPMFTAALFTIAKIRKQPKRPIDRWTDREAALHVYHGIISHKKKWADAICGNAATTGGYHTKWSKSEGRTPNDVTYTWNLKYDTSETICEIGRDSQR